MRNQIPRHHELQGFNLYAPISSNQGNSTWLNQYAKELSKKPSITIQDKQNRG